MVVRLLGDGIDVLGAVRDHAPVIGETVLAGVVGDGVVGVLGSLLARDQGHQEYKKQIQHCSAIDLEFRLTTGRQLEQAEIELFKVFLCSI